MSSTLSSNLHFSSQWGVHWMKKSIEQAGWLEQKRKKDPAKFNLQIVAIFHQLSQNPSPGKVSLKVEELTHFTKALKDCGAFSNENAATPKGFYLLLSLEDACKRKNAELALALALVGIPLTISAIKAAIELDLDHAVVDHMLSRIDISKKIPLFPLLCEKGYNAAVIEIFSNIKSQLQQNAHLLSHIFTLDEAMLLNLLDAGLPPSTSINEKTLIDLAIAKGFPALAHRLVDDPALVKNCSKNSSFSFLGANSSSMEACRNVFFALSPHISLEKIPDSFFHDMIERIERILASSSDERKRGEEESLLHIMQEVLQRVEPDQKKRWLNYQHENEHGQHGSPLIEARCSGLKKVALFLCNEGTDLSLLDVVSQSALSLAIENGDDELFQAIITRLKDMDENERKEILEEGVCSECLLGALPPPLLYALGYGKESYAQGLIQLGANLDGVDELGRNALFYALYGGLFDLVEKQIESGAWKIDSINLLNAQSIDLHDSSSELSNRDPPGIEFCKGNRWKAALWLIRHGLNIEANDEDQKTILHIASASSNPDALSVVEEILKYPLKDRILNGVDAHQRTPLIMACTTGSKDVIERLVGSGAETAPALANANTWNFDAWSFFWDRISEKEREAIKTKKLPFKVMTSDDKSSPKKNWELLRFFLDYDILDYDIPIYPDKTLLDLAKMMDIPLDLKKNLLQKLSNNSQEDRKNFENETDFSALFDEKIGDFDLTLQIGADVRVFKVVKNLLAARSEHFKEFFERQLQRPEEKQFIAALEPIPHAVASDQDDLFVKMVLRYFYSRKIEVNVDNFKGLAKWADHLCMRDLQGILKDWLEKHPFLTSWEKHLKPLSTPMEVSQKCKTAEEESKKRPHGNEEREVKKLKLEGFEQ